MSHTNETINYELPQFLGTDKPSWLTDINGAFSDIDAAIFAAKSAADAAATVAGGAASAVATLSGTVESLSTTVGTLANNVTTVTGTVNTITALIGNGTPTTTDKTLIGAINEINAKVGGDVLASHTVVNGETYGQVLTALAGSLDYTKLTRNAKLVIYLDASSYIVYNVRTASPTIAQFVASDVTLTDFYTDKLQVGATPHYYRILNGTNSEITGNGAGDGSVFKIFA